MNNIEIKLSNILINSLLQMAMFKIAFQINFITKQKELYKNLIKKYI